MQWTKNLTLQAFSKPLAGDSSLESALARAEFVLKELEALNQLHKYRTLKKNYYS
jgi:hypothetical protein